MKNLIIFLLSVLLIWFGSTIVRLENINYANILNMCPAFVPSQPSTFTETQECFDEVQTRTSFIWHLLYGLKLI
ncbi:hypothetical protein RC74_04235 [Falsihalocynthiibacter arcticus]|uniref:Uncharacterized protein n=1 Tax=Falsihalocynthiibacter arcticus TaxID=1579316 RepID=A0A126UXH7_9RHOB|nr:hypothetical protein RC74_04235 [Falsihalocynthiibacter arcticus]